MRRITIDEVRAACEATGYRLVLGVTLDDNRRCGCPIGITAKAAGVKGACSKFKDWGIGIDDDYAFGVMNGFDGPLPGVPTGGNYSIGHADGTAIRQALLPVPK